MNLKSIDKAYTSPYDKFLAEFDKTHSLSQSQIKEIKKAKEIAALRDGSPSDQEQGQIWEKF